MNVINTRTMYIPEVLEELDQLKELADRQQFLRKNLTPALQTLIAYTYDSRYQMVLSDAQIDEALDQPFTAVRDEMGMAPTHLFKEYKRLHLFLRSSETKQTPEQLQMRLVQLREILHPTEFTVVVNMLRKIPLSGHLNKALLKSVVPGLVGK